MTRLGRSEVGLLGPEPVLSDGFRDEIRTDIAAPPPLILLPLRLEYRVVEVNKPVRLAGNVAAIVRDEPDVVVRPERAGPSERHARPAVRDLRLNPAEATFASGRQIWFRWYPDEDFALHGVPPATDAELAALLRFDAACVGQDWHALDDPAVVSAWQVLAREVAPERALHLLRHRGEAGDPNYLDSLGTIPLLPEKVALFGLPRRRAPVMLGVGGPIDPTVGYSVRYLQQGGWHTDFDAAIKAGMALRLTDPEAVERALQAAWIIAVGLSKQDEVAGITRLLGDAIANGAFAFVPQDAATNNTPAGPTPYGSARPDLLAFLRNAADAEKGVLASPLKQSAELFAEALGIDVREVANAPSSGDLALEDARAMLRVIGPALIDTAVDYTTALSGIDEEQVIAFFEEAVVARGPLPLTRFGKSPYGLLPVAVLTDLAPLASDTDAEKQIESFVRGLVSVVEQEAQSSADATVPVLQPGDPNGSAKLETILKLNPVSRRLEVSTVGVPDSKALGCAYVTSATHPVAEYLAALTSQPIGELTDPTAADASWPLLYRLARLTLSKQTILVAVNTSPAFVNAKISTRVHLAPSDEADFQVASAAVAQRSLLVLAREPVVGLGTVGGRLQSASGRFLAAVQRLEAIAQEPDGVAKLETLLMETLDLFQHRIDAWATGIAYRRLAKRRRVGRMGLVGGYWGLLGRLRPDSITGRSDGYLQAPSPTQAATAAILRSAHLRHRGTGAFGIGLDSARVRQALKLLDMLQAGLSPGEALGYIAERLLHDRQQDILVFRLRDLFPLKDPRDDAAVETRLHDGLQFLNADVGSLVPSAEVGRLRALQTDLRQHFDALSDLVLAEATHLRSMGRTEAANAWLQVLSGETIPGMPSVIRTRRAGQGSTHRIVVLLDAKQPRRGDTPRAIAEPTLAAEAAARLKNFDNAVVSVTIPGASGAAVTRRFQLGADLGLEPIDLLVGGESEIGLRARHHLIALWREDAATQTALGPLPEADIMTVLNRVRPITISLEAGTPSAHRLLDLAAELRHANAQGRMLESSDLVAAADPAIEFSDARERDLLAGATEALAKRAAMLAHKLNTTLTALRNAIGPVVAAARNYQRLVDDSADERTLALAMVELATLRRPLDVQLLAASRFAEPGALRPFGSVEMAASPEQFDQAMAALVSSLSAKAAALATTLAQVTPLPTASAARVRRDALVATLRSTLDGEALPVLPPLRRSNATTPMLRAGPGRVATVLADWTPVRAKVARIAKLFAALPWRAHATSDAATGADSADADERTDEAIAPRARLLGTFVARRSPATTGTFTGFVADEWAEQRPSRMQQTGLAINYDSPQSEPPHAILLGEPTGSTAEPWSEAAAAAIVAEAIGLMKVRALAAQDQPLAGPLFPFANRVPFKQVRGAAAEPRIPVRRIIRPPIDAVFGDAAFVVDRTTSEVGVGTDNGSEISGFSRVQE